MPDLSGLLGGLLGEGSIARQFLVWNVLAAVASNELTPFLTALANKANARDPQAPLAPSELAALVVRELAEQGWAAGEAAKSGVSVTDFALMVANSGVGPAVTDLLSLYRLGKIDLARLDQGLARAGIDGEWTEVIKDLSIHPPTAQEALVALLQGQTTRDEAYARYVAAGGDPTWFETAFNSNGSAPTPDELSVMANRGVIPWDGGGPGVVSFHQGFLEGPWRDKWEEPYRKLAVYVPPPVTITTLVSGGYLSDADALAAFRDTGMTATMAAAYLAKAHGEKVAKTKDLARSEITTLYQDQAIDTSQATLMLQTLGYDQPDAAFILTIEDLQRERKFLEAAITKIQSLYVSYKIDNNQVLQALSQLDVPNSQITGLLRIWTLEREANQKDLTAAEIVAAVFYGIIDPPTGLAKLEQIGYTAFDAWVVLSNRLHGPVPDVTPPPDTATTT